MNMDAEEVGRISDNGNIEVFCNVGFEAVSQGLVADGQ